MREREFSNGRLEPGFLTTLRGRRKGGLIGLRKKRFSAGSWLTCGAPHTLGSTETTVPPVPTLSRICCVQGVDFLEPVT